MEALEAGERVTQRDLARVTGLNLKKVNYCLRKLLEKGHVKFQRARRNPDKRTYLYILTPAGLRAKSHLVAQGKRSGGLLRVPFVEVAEGRRILTVYWTSKAARYWREE